MHNHSTDEWIASNDTGARPPPQEETRQQIAGREFRFLSQPTTPVIDLLRRGLTPKQAQHQMEAQFEEQNIPIR